MESYRALLEAATEELKRSNRELLKAQIRSRACYDRFKDVVRQAGNYTALQRLAHAATIGILKHNHELLREHNNEED